MHLGKDKTARDHASGNRARALAALLALFAVGCGASNNQVAKSARRVPVAHIAELPPAERPKALATLPVVLESALVELKSEGGGLTLVARRTFYVLLRPEGPPAISLDGVDFEQPAKNSFGVGFEAKEGAPAKVRAAVRWHANAP